MNTRKVQQSWQAIATQDGAGVNLYRALGARYGQRLDPFLMLDNFSSNDPNDYIAGFPAHPHRGFETVTYIIDGHMKHRDHLGNEGDLKAGGVQWMTAGRGIIHEEMPMQKDGLLRGFQLWLNLPATEKMKPAHYQDIPSENMPWQRLAGGSIKLIAGQLLAGDKLQADNTRVTQPIIADVLLNADSSQTWVLPNTHQALMYIFEGEVQVAQQRYGVGDTLTLTQGELLTVNSQAGGRFLLIAGKALNEPIVQYGPFVMNTEEQIKQAIDDYRQGVLTA